MRMALPAWLTLAPARAFVREKLTDFIESTQATRTAYQAGAGRGSAITAPLTTETFKESWQKGSEASAQLPPIQNIGSLAQNVGFYGALAGSYALGVVGGATGPVIRDVVSGGVQAAYSASPEAARAADPNQFFTQADKREMLREAPPTRRRVTVAGGMDLWEDIPQVQVALPPPPITPVTRQVNEIMPAPLAATPSTPPPTSPGVTLPAGPAIVPPKLPAVPALPPAPAPPAPPAQTLKVSSMEMPVSDPMKLLSQVPPGVVAAGGAALAAATIVGGVAAARAVSKRKKTSKKKRTSRPSSRRGATRGTTRRTSSRKRAAAKRNKRGGAVKGKYRGKKVYIAKNGTPYVYVNGRPRFIKK